MFNDIFGKYWKGLNDDKHPDPSEKKEKLFFLMECRLLRIFNFFLKCLILQFLGTHKKIYKILKSA